MAPTVDFTQFRAEDGSNTKRRIQGIYTGPASYVTGGDPLVPADVKLGQIDVLAMQDGVLTGTSTLYTAVYDYTNQKLQWFVGTTGVEVANGVSLATLTARFEAIGR